MNILMICLFGIIFPLMMGHGIILLIFRKKEIKLSIYEMLALSLGLGIGILTLYMFLLGVLGIEFSLWSISSIYLLALPNAIYQIWARRKQKMYCFQKVHHVLPKKSWMKWILIVPGILILRNIFSTFFVVLGTPTYPDDATSNWNFRAKVFYYTQSLNLDKAGSTDKNDMRLFNGGMYTNYPMLNPFYKAYLGFSMHEYEDRGTNIVSPIFGILILVLLFGYFLRKYGLKKSLLFVGGYTLIPFVWIHSMNTYAETGVIYYVLATVILILNYLEHKKTGYLIVAGLFAACMGWVKNEGLIAFFVGIFGALAFIEIILPLCNSEKINKKNIYDMIKFALPTVVFFVVWKLFLGNYDMAIGSGTAEVMKGSIALKYHPEALGGLKKILFDFGSYSILPIIFIGSSIVFFKNIFHKKENMFIFLSVIFAFIIMLFVFTYTDLYQSMLSGDSRQFMILIVLVYFFISQLFLSSHGVDEEG